MILSDRVTPSWLPERFECDEEMLTAIKAAYESLKEVLVVMMMIVFATYCSI